MAAVYDNPDYIQYWGMSSLGPTAAVPLTIQPWTGIEQHQGLEKALEKREPQATSGAKPGKASAQLEDVQARQLDQAIQRLKARCGEGLELQAGEALVIPMATRWI